MHDICNACDVALTYPSPKQNPDVKIEAIKDHLAKCDAQLSDFDPVTLNNSAIVKCFSVPNGLPCLLCDAPGCHAWYSYADALRVHAAHYAWCSSCTADYLPPIPNNAQVPNAVRFELKGEIYTRTRLSFMGKHFITCPRKSSEQHQIAKKMKTFLTPFLIQRTRPGGQVQFVKQFTKEDVETWKEYAQDFEATAAVPAAPAENEANSVATTEDEADSAATVEDETRA